MKAKAKKQLIIEKSAQLFLEKGFAASSMREIARLVDLEPSSIYSHIRSKRELLSIICFHHAQYYLKSLEVIIQENPEPGQQLKKLIELHIDRAITDKSSALVFGNEWKNLDSGQLLKFKAFIREYEEMVISIIEKGIEKGHFKELEAEYAMRTLLSAIRWIHFYHRPFRKISADKLKKELTDLLLNGAKKKLV